MSIHKIYPDSIEGAIQGLSDLIDIKPNNIVKVITDTHIHGFWCVILDNGNHYLIYLKGYKNQNNEIRQYNYVVLPDNQ